MVDWTSEDEREIDEACSERKEPVFHAGLDDSRKEIFNIDWSSDDEQEIEDASTVPMSHGVECGPSSSFAALPDSRAVDEFLSMGFSVNMVEKALKACGLNDKEAVLDALLTYNMIENSPDDFGFSLNPEEEPDCKVYETKGASEMNTKDSIVSKLVGMGYAAKFASAAIDRCGIDAPIFDLVDMIAAVSLAYDSETSIRENLRGKGPAIETQERCHASNKKRKLRTVEGMTIKRHKAISDEGRLHGKKTLIHDDDDLRFRKPTPLIGFGLPSSPASVTHRKIPAEAEGPPYFYYANGASNPNGVWPGYLYGITPELVDSKHFSAVCIKMRCIHNLPVKGRFQISPGPPKTIAEAFPHTKDHWPIWDPRKQLNSILTCVASAQLTENIRERVNKSGGPSAADKEYVLMECKKWNLIWVAKQRVAPLEPDEVDRIMGFQPNHTRGGGVTRTQRYTALGNTFQVDTVAYHLSVLKSMFPNGLNVLSLNSGIGGPEVALHKLGIRLKNVVSVEKSETCRKILQGWWNNTHQEGKLIHLSDVDNISTQRLNEWIYEFGGFDLIIGGTGLDSEHSSFEYNRIIHKIRELMRGRV